MRVLETIISDPSQTKSPLKSETAITRHSDLVLGSECSFNVVVTADLSALLLGLLRVIGENDAQARCMV